MFVSQYLSRVCLHNGWVYHTDLGPNFIERMFSSRSAQQNECPMIIRNILEREGQASYGDIATFSESQILTVHPCLSAQSKDYFLNSRCSSK